MKDKTAKELIHYLRTPLATLHLSAEMLSENFLSMSSSVLSDRERQDILALLETIELEVKKISRHIDDVDSSFIN